MSETAEPTVPTTEGFTITVSEEELYVIVTAVGAFVQTVLGPGVVGAITRGNTEQRDDFTRLAEAGVAFSDRTRDLVKDGPTSQRLQEHAAASARARESRIIVPEGRIIVPGEGR